MSQLVSASDPRQVGRRRSHCSLPDVQAKSKAAYLAEAEKGMVFYWHVADAGGLLRDCEG